MGRTILWSLGVVAIGVLAWMLFAGGEEGGQGAGFDPLGLHGEREAADPDGPGLLTREGVRQLETGDKIERGDAAVHGIVVDERGRPQPGVEVAASFRAPSPTNYATASLFDAPFRPYKVVETATTDAAGAFVIRGLVLRHSYSLTANVPPPMYSARTTATAKHGSASKARLVVGEGSALRGRVVDASGAGIKARVSVGASGRTRLPQWLSSSWSVPSFECGADGRFTLPAVPPGRLTFTLTVAGRGQRSGIRVEAPRSDEVELRFEEAGGASVLGRVVDTAGGAVAGARVLVTCLEEGEPSRRIRTSRGTTTDETGSYLVERLAPGEISQLHVSAPGYVSRTRIAAGRPLEEGEPVRVDVVLARGATVVGRVLDGEGNALPGASVTLGRAAGGGTIAPRATSGSDGRFELTGVPLGPQYLTATLFGYYAPEDDDAAAPTPWSRTPKGTRIDAGAEGDRLEVDLVLEPGIALTGTAADERGAPVAGAVITLGYVRRNRGFFGSSTQTPSAVSAADGTFTVPGVEPGNTYRVQARTDTHVSPSREVVVPGPDTESPLALVLKPGATVAGRAATSDGTVVSGMEIRITNGAGPTFTDAEGSYAFAGVEAGSQTLTPNLPYGSRNLQRSVVVEWGQRLGGIDFTLEAGSPISGTVVDEDGAPAGGIRVQATREKAEGRQRHHASAVSGADGRFELQYLPEGTYVLTAGGKESRVTAATGTTDVQLVYAKPRPKILEGTVSDAQGNPVESGYVRVTYKVGDGKRSQSTQAAISAGYFRVKLSNALDTASVQVRSAFDAGGRALNFSHEQVNDVSLSDGPVSLTLGVGLELRGRVVDTAGAAVPGVGVSVTKKGSNSMPWMPSRYGGGGGQVRSADDGTFRLIGLEDEDVTVKADPGGAWVTPDPIDARPGGGEIVFTLSKGLSIGGQVVDTSGTPLAGASVALQETAASRKSRGDKTPTNNWMSQFRLRGTTDGQGRFEIKGLPERALYKVSASLSGGTVKYTSESIDDVLAGSLDLRLTLREGTTIEGVLVGPDDEPVTRAWLRAEPVDEASGLKPASGHLNGRTNKFSIGPLQPGRYRITAQIHDNAWTAPKAFEVDAPAKGVRVVVLPAQQLRGKVLGEDVSGFMVMFTLEGTNTSSGQVEEDGSFSIKLRGTGKGRVFATKRGDNRYALLEDHDPASGAVDLRLQEGGTIRGRVEGLPPETRGAQVYASGGGIWLYATLEATGDFTMVGVPPGEFQIHGWAGGGRIQGPEKVRAGASGVVLTFKKNG